MDGRTYVDLKGISFFGSITINIEIRLKFEEKEKVDEHQHQHQSSASLVGVEGEFEHSYVANPAEAEIEFVKGTYNPNTREMVLLGNRRTGKFPKDQRPIIINENCNECECNAYRTEFLNDRPKHSCFCGHKIHSHQNRPALSHLVIVAQYTMTLPHDLSEKFDVMARCQRDPNHTAVLQFWEEGVAVKPALR